MDFFKHYHAVLTETLGFLPNQFSSMELAAEAISKSDQVVCIGVGKSSFVANKLSASLASIGINSIFLHPSDAMHGDIGILGKSNKLAVVFSKSGNSKEINEILPFLTERQTHIISVCNRRESNLGRYSKIFIDISSYSEGEPLNILPLISIDISMIVANMLISAVSQKIGLTQELFSRNHPGGQLGKNVSLKVLDLSVWKMRRPFVCETTTIKDAIVIGSKFRAGLVCVTDQNQRLMGIISDGDVRRALQMDIDICKLTTGSLMNTSPVVLSACLHIGDALRLMENPDKQIFSAPVIDADGVCCGVITIHDLVS